MNEEICSAIRRRRLLRLTYNGIPREVEPYCYGLGTTGRELLRGYQIAGPARPGRAAGGAGWRLFDVARIGALSVLEETFPGGRPEYRHADPALRQSFCCL